MMLFEGLHAFPWTDPTSNNANSYLITVDKNILVDPGHAHLFGALRDHLEGLALTPENIDLVIATHAHPDHVEAVQYFSGSSTLIGFPLMELEQRDGGAPSYPVAFRNGEWEPDLFLREGTLEAGSLTLRVYHTPGHTPGSICLYWPEKKALFSGDVVFKQGIGRTDLPGGNSQQLKKSIVGLSALEVDFLLPGHGDILRGSDPVRRNFRHIEEMWFPYL